MKPNRPSLQSLKLQAFRKWGVRTTKQLKKQYFAGYDFRTRAAWLEAAGMTPLKEMLCEGASNIVPTGRRFDRDSMLEAARLRFAAQEYVELFSEADRIVQDD